MNRRKFIKQTFWGITGLGVFSGLYAWQIEPFLVGICENKNACKDFNKQFEDKDVNKKRLS